VGFGWQATLFFRTVGFVVQTPPSSTGD